jgi:transcriptional regulator with XRE-family HTH domain
MGCLHGPARVRGGGETGEAGRITGGEAPCVTMERMTTRVRTRLALDAEGRNREQLARLGATIRDMRRRRRLTQAALGTRIGLSQSAVSRLERGLGGGMTLDAWQRIALAVGTHLQVSLPRDALQEPIDAGHLAVQELVLRLGRPAGYRGLVELATRQVEPWRAIDVALVDDVRRRLTVVECWNSMGDVGAAARASNRKLAEVVAMAAARWGEQAHAVGLVWVVRATRRNRSLVARYPEVFRARFPGSSAGWVRALTTGADLPSEPGLVWASVDGSRLFPWRRR